VTDFQEKTIKHLAGAAREAIAHLSNAIGNVQGMTFTILLSVDGAEEHGNILFSNFEGDQFVHMKRIEREFEAMRKQKEGKKMVEFNVKAGHPIR
jgi:hypothetical protein